jgi:hypothetical protein
MTACDLLDHSFAPVEPVARWALPSSISLMMSCGSRTGFSVRPCSTWVTLCGDADTGTAHLHHNTLFSVLARVKLGEGG